MQNIYDTLCQIHSEYYVAYTIFYQNQPSFQKQMTESFWLLFSVERCMLSSQRRPRGTGRSAPDTGRKEGRYNGAGSVGWRRVQRLRRTARMITERTVAYAAVWIINVSAHSTHAKTRALVAHFLVCLASSPTFLPALDDSGRLRQFHRRLSGCGLAQWQTEI